MKISTAPLPMRRSLLALALVAVVAGVAACGGTATPTTVATPGTSPTVPASPVATSSPTAVPSVAPVPVESNPPGDIPDNLAFVTYTNRPGGYSFTHPEGWARTGTGTAVRFTDKLNGVAANILGASTAPTVASARSTDVARLRNSVPAFDLRDIAAISLPAGKGVRIVFRRNSDPDPVTGRVYRDEVEEYLVFRAGRLVVMDLYGPVGADNVDAYRTMSQSLTIR